MDPTKGPEIGVINDPILDRVNDEVGAEVYPSIVHSMEQWRKQRSALPATSASTPDKAQEAVSLPAAPRPRH